MAAEKILKEGIADLVIIGDEETIHKKSKGRDLTGATLIDPAHFDRLDEYVDKFTELRAKKGMTKEKAREILLTDYPYFGVMMVKMGDADGMGIRRLPLLCRHAAPLPADPQDQTGHPSGIRILRGMRSGLRAGSRRQLCICGRWPEPEPES